jgi:hypothetical protein
MSKAVYFGTQSNIRDGNRLQSRSGKLLSRYPIAHVEITAYTEPRVRRVRTRNWRAVAPASVLDALRKMGAPISASVSVNAVGEPEGVPDDNQPNQEYRRVDIMVAPHAYNKGQ